ncbi:MAG: hypothetical protein NTU53_10560, partial [Planctomycetota bacterium]|nr:hypothetical protein [Planctomycetota bacterium]
FPSTVRMILSGYADIGMMVEAINKGEIYRFMSKPWNDAELRVVIRQGLERHAIVGENLMLNAFIHNIEHDPLSMHPPDWSSLQIDVRRELVLMRVSTADAQYAQVARGQAWWSAVPTSLLLAPGKYTLRLEFNSPELPVTYARAWHGRVVSNEATIEVVAQ